MVRLRSLYYSAGAFIVVLIIIVAEAVELDLATAAARVNELALSNIDADMADPTVIP